MACHIAKNSLIRTAAVRCYSSSPSAVPIGGISNYDVQSSSLPNKMVVASADNGNPIARVSILFRAGSRYETSESMGAAHVLRIAAGLSTKHCTQFAIMRNVQQVGANITCISDREVVAYTLEGTCDALSKSMTFLGEMAAAQVFKPWELEDNIARIKLELATRSPTVRAIDLLHKAAYRTGLGNSLFIAKHLIGKINSESMQHYFASTCKTNRCAVVGMGIDHDNLLAFAKSLSLESGAGVAGTASAYKGGELRKEKGGDRAYIAIATEGAAVSNAEEAVAFAVLQQALGTGPFSKRGYENKGLLAKANAEVRDYYKLAALNANYSDSGLFGVFAECPSKIAGKITENAVSVLKGAKVSEEDVKRGKAQLTTAVLLALESGSNQLKDIGEQALLLGGATNPMSVVERINAVSSSAVQNAARKVASGKLSIGSIGNIRNVPYLGDLQ